jgi:hypothetical protein
MTCNFSKPARKRFSIAELTAKKRASQKRVDPLFCDVDMDLRPLPKIQAVYFNSKLSHNGITSYKVFEGFDRKRHPHSLANLLNQTTDNSEAVSHFVKLFRICLNKDDRSRVIDEAVETLDYNDYQSFLQQTFLTRSLSPMQSKKTRSLCQKLEYYSAVRKFRSKKSGEYSFKIAFLTLTAPECAEPFQILQAFEHFLDYLRRTANCVYVWKKELGECGEKLHFHLMLNNFIPYYIVNWKWKRLLINEGVIWPVTEKGVATDSHYRIELPRSRKKIGHYISKYMSKAYALPQEFGYISGHSKLLDTCEEIRLIENDVPIDELEKIMSGHKVIRSEFMSHICVDLLHVKHIAPKIGALFDEQYIKFCEKLTLPQKFYEC